MTHADFNKYQSLTVKAVLALAMLLGGFVARAADDDLGKVGAPIHLKVHHPCCYAAVWSGYVLRGKEFWKKYLPAGSTVEFEYGLQGAITVNQLLAGKAMIGYMGDLPAFTATTKGEIADLRIVGVTVLSRDQCSVMLVRKDAPAFKNSKEAIQWMNGKQVATPKGSCTDHFVQHVFGLEKVKPAAYLNQNIEVISSGFRSGRLDAAAIWEPNAANMVQEGLARRVSSGNGFGHEEGAFIAMRAELVKQRPDIVKGWLNAELDAQLFIADPKNAMEVVRMVSPHVTGFSEKGLWMALFGSYPDDIGGGKNRGELPFTFEPKVMSVIDKGVAWLQENKGSNVAMLRPDAVMPEFAAEVLRERKLKTPIGVLNALPDSAYTGKAGK